MKGNYHESKTNKHSSLNLTCQRLKNVQIQMIIIMKIKIAIM